MQKKKRNGFPYYPDLKKRNQLRLKKFFLTKTKILIKELDICTALFTSESFT